MSKSLFNKINNIVVKYTILLLVFFLPFFKVIIPPLIILWTISWFIEGEYKEKFNFLKKSSIFYFLIIFYLWHVVGLLFTKNIDSGLFDLEVKFSFLLLPIITSTNVLRNKNYKVKVLTVFIVSNFLASLFCLIRATYRILTIDAKTVFQLPDYITPFDHFFSHNQLSFFIHPSYFAMYITFCLIIIIYAFKQPEYNKYGYFLFILFFFFAFMIYLLSSKSGIIAMVGVLGVIAIMEGVVTKNRKLLISLILFILFFGVVSVLFNLRIFFGIKELTNIKDNFNSKNLEVKPIINNNDTIIIAASSIDRILVWKSSIELIKRNPILGTGCGDIKDDLIAIYYRDSLESLKSQKLNAHNQYLETTIGQGIIGLLLLLTLLLWPFVLAICQKDILGIGFITVIAINFMFESMLNTQAGVVFFAFFYCFLFIAMEPNKKASEINKIT